MLIDRKINLVRYLFSFLFTSIFFSLYAQDEIKGTLLNKKSGEALSYATIQVKNDSRGAVTNEDGAFELQCFKNDTLIISYISFERKEIPCTYFIENQIYYLNPVINELKTVEISASKNTDYMLDLLISAKKKIRKTDHPESKAYFTLKSNFNNRPLELLECYYNTQLSPDGFENLQLKNGRIGVSKMDNQWFVSLSTTEIISDYHILNKKYNKLPANPLQLNKRQIKKSYDYKYINIGNGVLKLEFTPKSNNKNLFSSIVHIDKHNKLIKKITLFANNLKQHPFRAINSRDYLSNLNLKISYTYNSELPINTLNKISFNYNFDYQTRNDKKGIATDGVFVFYDVNNPFDLPYYTTPENLDNDYQKIIGLPYNEAFWQTNTTVLPSEEQIQFKKFFAENGVLHNFHKLKDDNPMLETRIIPWSNKRIFLSTLNEDVDYQVDLNLSDHLNFKTISSLYDLSAQIYLDRNVVKDKAVYLSRTNINTNKSFYYLSTNKNTTCFLNLYFDQFEVTRRALMEKLNESEWTKDQVDSIFYATESKLKVSLSDYLKLVKHGNNEVHLGKYIDTIKTSLYIDNSVLIHDENTIAQLDAYSKTNFTYVDYYNYGSALFKQGKYRVAKDILLKCLELDDTHPWLYYNLGLTDLYLGDTEAACKYFHKAIDMGESNVNVMMKHCPDK